MYAEDESEDHDLTSLEDFFNILRSKFKILHLECIDIGKEVDLG